MAHLGPEGSLVLVERQLHDGALTRHAGTDLPPGILPGVSDRLSPFRLHDEYLKQRPGIKERREKYFSWVDGQRRINLRHADIEAARAYGNAVLNGEKEMPDGTKGGLRERASSRNKGHKYMEEMAAMSFTDRIAHAKTYRPKYLEPGSETGDYLHARDYPKATAGVNQWGKALFYHDAPLLVEGILASDIKDKVDYAQGTVEDLVIELYVNGLIPNGSSEQLDSRSQTPSLTRMGWRVYESMIEEGRDQQESLAWLGNVMDAAEYEFKHYWKNETRFNHYVPGSTLITPGDVDIGAHDTAERETSRDMTSEYSNRAHDHIDPNINGELVGYAWDIALYKKITGKQKEADKWQELGDAMAAEMSDLLFTGENYGALDIRQTGKINAVLSLTGYMPLALGIPKTDEAQAMAAQLYKYRGPYGMCHIVPESVPPPPSEETVTRFDEGMRPTVRELYGNRQWGDGKKNIPEWAIETHSLIKGLRRYGFYDLAIEVAEDWILGYTEYFKKYGTLPEKRNVITGENGHGVEYAQQVDFGWSIANYLWLQKELAHMYKLRDKPEKKTVTFPEHAVLFEAETVLPEQR